MAEFGKMVYYDLADLKERLGHVEMRWFVRESESDFLRMANDVADRAAWNPDIKAIFISGPSSSGKTTFANRLAGALHLHGRSTVSLHLDDYYREKRTGKDALGRPDFESIDTLSIDLIVEHIDKLLHYGEVNVPSYDFVTRKRSFDPRNKLTMEPRGILLVEGLHGLSKEIEQGINPANCLKVFIMPYATLTANRCLLDSRDIRILRRVSRDHFKRSTNPFSTIDYWPMLDASEEAVFPEYLARADVFINSAMPYEFFVIAPLAAGLIEQELADYREGKIKQSIYMSNGKLYADLSYTVKKAIELVAATRDIPCVSPDVVPAISILNEFLGK